MDVRTLLIGISFSLLVSLGGSINAVAETPPYIPNKINFNQANANGLVEDLKIYAMTIAKKYVQRYGGFAPFGVSITISGEYQVVVGNGKDPKKDLAMLLNNYRQKAQENEIVAAIVVYDTRVNVPNQNRVSDAIYITVDSKLTPSRNGFALYSKVKPGHYRFENLQPREQDKTSIFSASR